VTEGATLLAADEPGPILELSRHGGSPFVIVVDHAGARIPRSLGDLGLPAAELKRHIAWDIGALAVARRVAVTLDAGLIAQNYSRLVIDCNRDPKVESSIPPLSESTAIPGNAHLSEEQRSVRRREIFEPYHQRIRERLNAREEAGRPTVLVALHSMTDVYLGVRREMHAAILYNRDRRFAQLMLENLRREPGLNIADNEPYFVSDATDYTIPRHGEARGLPHVEIELRQDLIGNEADQAGWAERLSRALLAAQRAFFRYDAEHGRAHAQTPRT
jgi:predicted N-formylglutamate amidohydrolase